MALCRRHGLCRVGNMSPTCWRVCHFGGKNSPTRHRHYQPSPSQYAQPFDAPPRRAFLSSPVEDSRQFLELIHPPHDTSVQNSPLADRAIAYSDDDSDVSVCHRR